MSHFSKSGVHRTKCKVMVLSSLSLTSYSLTAGLPWISGLKIDQEPYCRSGIHSAIAWKGDDGVWKSSSYRISHKGCEVAFGNDFEMANEKYQTTLSVSFLLIYFLNDP